MPSRFRPSYVLPLSILAVAAFPAALAQTVTGSVSGTVTDPTGAVIPNATVAVHNVDTGVTTTATTNGSGVYAVRFLPIGRYDVTITATGFQTQAVPAFALEINQTAKIDGKLSAGGSNTEVEVSTVAPILNTNDSSLGISLSTNEISNLPLNGRNFSSATLFQPGAVSTNPNGLTGNNAIERNTYNDGVVNLNGNRAQANNYTLDGADQNEGQNNLIAYNPAPDALAEVRVVSANASAQFGNANGGAVLSVLKSGTNQFHGSAYAYLENYNLDANTWGNKFNGVPRNPFTQTLFGGTIGGPIFRDKLFFFADYEAARRHTGGLQVASVLPAAFRTGDFRNDGGVPLYNTQAGFAPYANNQLPINNPVARYLFAHPELYPLPNTPSTSGVFGNNYQAAQRNFVVNNQGDIKIEYDKGNSNKFTAFYSQSDAYDGQTALFAVTFPPQNVYPTKLGGGNWIHTFSPAIVNEARFGFTRVRWDNSIPTDPSGQFGYSGNSKVGIPFGAQSYVGFSNIGIGGDASSIGTPANVQILRDNTFNYYDNLTWQKGRHLLSIGGQATRYQQNYVNSSNYGFLGSFNYNGSFTAQPGGTGYAPADFVLDQASQTQLGSAIGIVGNRQWRVAGYIQDDWKATDRLTLNLGVRYEYDEPWREAHNKTANVLLATGQVIYAGSVPAGAVAGSGVCPTTACYNGNYAQIMPRIGFAFQATPRLVLRGGYGATSFFEGDASNQRLTSSPPFAQGSNLNALTPSAANGGTPFAIENGFTPQFDATSQYSVWPQNQQPAYIHNFNLTTEVAVSTKTSVQVSYLGETGHHLADYRNANQLTLAQSNAIAALPANAPIPAADVAPYASLVGQNGGLLVTESAAIMNYNAGQVTLRQRATRGLEATFNYTYGRAMTNSSGNYGNAGINGQNGAFQDGYNSYADYGPAGTDVRHNFNGVIVYALPVGRGQQFGSHLNPVLDLLVGGWRGSASVVMYSGFPLTVNNPNGSNNTNSYGQERANQYRHIHVVNRSVSQWFGNDPSAVPCTSSTDNGVCAFAPAANGSFGTASVGSLRTPGYRTVDTSAFKDFHFTENQLIGFRADFFNVMNIASYGNPASNLSDPTHFGQISSVRSQQRQIQFSAHYSF